MYSEQIQEYEQFEEARKQMRHNELAQGLEIIFCW